jgi:hypothetical protein
MIHQINCCSVSCNYIHFILAKLLAFRTRVNLQGSMTKFLPRYSTNNPFSKGSDPFRPPHLRRQTRLTHVLSSLP